MSGWRASLALLGGVVIAGCPGPMELPIDASSVDSSSVDASRLDGGADGGRDAAATVDAALPDAPVVDAAAPDAFAPDAAAPDAFAPDAFAPDAFAPDAFTPDAFTPDAPTFCVPSATQACYSGPPATRGVGRCSDGIATCLADGSAFGPCAGDVTPITEDCATPGDDNCDGTANEGCRRTYAMDVQPILQRHCAPCHTSFGSGGANFAVRYADSQLPSYYCPGRTKGECTLTRIQDGTMPNGAGCTGNPTLDAANAACLTAAEQTVLQQWIADGQLP